MKYTIISLFCTLFLFSAISIAGTTDQNVDSNKYIEYGNGHECVVKLDGKDDTDKKFYASAVIFKPRWALTAAHIIKNAKSLYVTVNNEPIKVEFSCHHSDYQDNIFGMSDIGIIYFEKAIDLKFYPELYQNDDESGKLCSIAGYGVTGFFQSSDRFNDEKKRAGSNFVDKIEKDLLICSLNKGKKTSLEFLISHGDSGGGLFIDNKLAGINSCVFSDDGKLDSNINDESGHTRVSKFVSWINNIIAAVENAEQSKNAK